MTDRQLMLKMLDEKIAFLDGKFRTLNNDLGKVSTTLFEFKQLRENIDRVLHRYDEENRTTEGISSEKS